MTDALTLEKPEELEIRACSDARVAGRWSGAADPVGDGLPVAMRFAECLVRAGVEKNLGQGAKVRTIEASATSFRAASRQMEAECRRVINDGHVFVWETAVTSASGKPCSTIRHVQVIESVGGARQKVESISNGSSNGTRVDRRDELVRAATRVFSQKGFVKASVKDVATDAGITTPTLYHYVKTKEDLLNLVFTTTITKIDDTLHEGLEGRDSAQDALESGISALMKMYERDSPVIMLLHEEARYLRPEDRKNSYELSAKSLENWQRLLQDGVKSGEFDIPDPDVWAQLVSILCTARPLRFWNLKGVKAERLQTAVIDFVTRAITAQK